LGINLHSGHLFQVQADYDGITLAVTIEDEQTFKTAAQNYLVDIPSIVGPTAHVGFSAATGGLTAEQDILSWDFASL
jgi:hypothetical protein